MALFDRLFRREQGQPQPSAAETKPASAEQKDKEEKLPFEIWMAMKADSPDQVAELLGLHDIQPCSWEDGMRQIAEPGMVLVTEPVDGFCFAIGSAMPNLAYRAIAGVWLEELGKKMPALYYFAACRSVSVYFFAQVENGVLLRAYAAAQGEVKVNKGDLSAAEQAADLHFPQNDDELFETAGITPLTPQNIAKLAGQWSVSPFAAAGKAGFIGRIDRR